MNIMLWVLQVLLAVAFFAHGWLFLSPLPEVAEQMNASLPRWFQLFLGVAEVLAAVGLTLPGLTRIMPWLVTWAAGGIIIVTVSATAFHLMRGEMSSAAITLLLLAMATRRVHAASCAADWRPARRIGNETWAAARCDGRVACRLGVLLEAINKSTRVNPCQSVTDLIRVNP
jgi:uncharacterized membrane protein YphA (DoxX/SURF4 family)